MKACEVIKTAYRIIGSKTPLPQTDCGLLCRNACCKGERTTGMLLFPFEEKLYTQNSDMEVVSSPFVYGEDLHAKLLLCSGKCLRFDRPLSCRIFPLAPFRKADEKIYFPVLDPRAHMLCPLAAANDMSLLDPEFVLAAKRVFAYLALFPQIRPFLEALSEEAKDWGRFTL